MDIAKRGKRKNQEKEATTKTKKKVTANQTSDDQLTPEASVVNSFTQTNYNKPELEIQEDVLFDEMPGQMTFFETDKTSNQEGCNPSGLTSLSCQYQSGCVQSVKGRDE